MSLVQADHAPVPLLQQRWTCMVSLPVLVFDGGAWCGLLHGAPPGCPVAARAGGGLLALIPMIGCDRFRKLLYENDFHS